MPNQGGGEQRGALSLYLNVCLRPRATLRASLDEDAQRQVSLMTRLAGTILFIATFGRWALESGDSDLPVLVFLAVVVAAIAPAVLALIAVPITWGGWLFHGRGNWTTVRGALAWSSWVFLLLLPVGLLAVILNRLAFGEGSGGNIASLPLLLASVHAVIGISVAHRFSLGRAVAAIAACAVGTVLLLALLLALVNPNLVEPFYLRLTT